MLQELLDAGINHDEALEIIDTIENGEQEPLLKYAPIALSNVQERYILGPVLIPNHIDSQNHIIPRSVIKKTAFNFMEYYRTNKFMHVLKLNTDDVVIVESYIAPIDMVFDNGIFVKKGTWMLGVIVKNDAIWSKISKGSITGFSIGGTPTAPPININNGMNNA